MPRKILLVDDDPSLRELVSATLDDTEYEILEARDGIGALEMARREAPALIVLDWMMPGLTGVKVTKALRDDPAMPRMPIILLTAKSQASDIAAGYSAGVDAFLTKPFSPLALLDKVEELLAKR